MYGEEARPRMGGGAKRRFRADAAAASQRTRDVGCAVVAVLTGVLCCVLRFSVASKLLQATTTDSHSI